MPYWRDQGMILSVLGQLGPVIGLFMHVRKYGFHPPTPSSPDVIITPEKFEKNSDVENPVRFQ
jgi:hypothetical protein